MIHDLTNAGKIDTWAESSVYHDLFSSWNGVIALCKIVHSLSDDAGR